MAGFAFPGNAIPAPAFNTGATSQDLELLWSMVGYTQKGVSLQPGQGIIPLGCVLGQVTTTKQWKIYASGNSDGSQNPVGFLRQTVDTGLAGSTVVFQNNIVVSGKIRKSLMSGADANAITVLKGRDLSPSFDCFTF